VPKRAQLIRVLYDEIGRLLPPLNVTTQAMDGRAPRRWASRSAKLMVFYERLGHACTPNISPAACTCRAVGDRRSAKLILVLDDTRPAHREPHLQAAKRRHRRQPADCLKLGFSGVMLRGSGAAWDCAGAATSAIPSSISTFPSAERRQLRPLLTAWRTRP
jgi:NADH-quinone oxidoreductase subunit D